MAFSPPHILGMTFLITERNPKLFSKQASPERVIKTELVTTQKVET